MHLRLAVLALAVCALSLVAVSPALAAPKISGGAATFSGKGNPATGELITMGGKKVNCTSNTGNGTLAANGLEGTISVVFLGCESGGAKCKTATATNAGEVIVGSYTYLVVLTNLTPMYALLVEVPKASQVVLKCGAALTINVFGSVILDTNLQEGIAVKEFTITGEENGTKLQSMLACLEPTALCVPGGTAANFELLSEFAAGVTEESALIQKDEVTANKLITAEG
jgi:hypothetical protein